jgi:hypothetical protein
MYSFPSLSAEARQAARWCAQHGYSGLLNDPLPEGISRRAYLEIHDNLITFRGLIAEYAKEEVCKNVT